MKAALIGLPQSGKSTLFGAVTGKPVEAYLSEVCRAVVGVPDQRLAFLTELCKPKKVTQATLEFLDVPGSALDDAAGCNEWRKHLPTVRQAELLVVVLRDFENDSVPAYRNRVDADADLQVVWDELVFADLDTVTTRLERIEKALKKPTKTHEHEKREQAVLVRCQESLEAGQPLSSVLTGEEEKRQVSSFSFLTQKPILVVRNVDDGRAAEPCGWKAPHAEGTLSLCASVEADIASLDEADRPAFLADLGLESPASSRLIRACYDACGAISFLTMGPDEVRAWTIRRGATAVEAAGKIHSDIAHGFIRAETVSYDDLVAHQDFKGAKAAGKVRKEGKTYEVADGDILNILWNA